MANKRLPEDIVLVSYDLSFPVLNVDPTYQSGTGQDSEWTIIAACTIDHKNVVAGSNLAVAIVETSRMTAAITATAKRGGYNHYLKECEK